MEALLKLGLQTHGSGVPFPCVMSGLFDCRQRGKGTQLRHPRIVDDNVGPVLSGMFRRSASLAIPHLKSFAAIPSVS